MSRILIRTARSTETGWCPRKRIAVALLPFLGACVSYEAAPVDVTSILADLEARQFHPPEADTAEQAEGVTALELSNFAVVHNPSLNAVRAQLGVSESLLVQAGLISDPEFSWDSMNVVGAQIVNQTTTPVDFISGLGINVTLPRPGELDAKEGVAEWELEKVRRTIVQIEWALARDVYIACEDVLETERLLEQNKSLSEVAETTREYFERAQAAGAATAIQGNLATGDLLAVQADRVLLVTRVREARQKLNALLGLSPTAVIPVLPSEVPESEPEKAPESLVETAIALRPDISTLHASYQAAEDNVRLEVARQYPELALGTAIAITPGFFTRFNKPAIRTAMAERAKLGAQFEAAIHEVRRDIFDACSELQGARLWLQFLESELLPNAERSLELAGDAFNAGEVTLLEILTLQRTLVDARTRTTTARADLNRRHWRLVAASGTLLAQPNNEAPDSPGTKEAVAR